MVKKHLGVFAIPPATVACGPVSPHPPWKKEQTLLKTACVPAEPQGTWPLPLLPSLGHSQRTSHREGLYVMIPEVAA